MVGRLLLYQEIWEEIGIGYELVGWERLYQEDWEEIRIRMEIRIGIEIRIGEKWRSDNWF